MRSNGERRQVLRFERWDVVIALGIAGLVNVAMLAVAAQLFHTSGLTGLDSLQKAHITGYYTGHSFRRGGATFAFRCGVPASLIKLQGDWHSDTYLLYTATPARIHRLCSFTMATSLSPGLGRPPLEALDGVCALHMPPEACVCSTRPSEAKHAFQGV